MGREYYDDVLDIAIKYAGRELLRDTALESPSCGETRFSEGFEKKMERIISGEIRKRRTSKIIKIASRAAAALLILAIVSTVVVFSSEALRSQVFNMFSEIGGDSVDIQGYVVSPEGIPEGMIMPGYIPEGFTLTMAEKYGYMAYKSKYEDGHGSTISILQTAADSSVTIDNDGNAYETDISGVKAIACENDGNNIIAFIYKEYAYVLMGDDEVELSELKKTAQSIIDR